MKNGRVVSVLFVAVGLTCFGNTFAYGMEKHDKHSKHRAADAQMKKLHAIMPMFSQATANLEKSIEKGDAAAAEIEMEKLLRAIPELKKSKPHKNVKQHKKFVELAESLEVNLTSTRLMVAKRDFNSAKKAFKKVESVCAACHAKFRD
jgi:cytochrome c556